MTLCDLGTFRAKLFNSNSEFYVEKTMNAFSAATSSKLYHVTTGHLFVCRLELYVRISWSKGSTPALVPL